MIDCKMVAEKLFEYLDGELNGPSTTEIEEHLKLCRACFSHREFETLLRSHIREKTFHACPDSLKKKIQNIIEQF
ncbi:MAG: zf-HC2 domain-containing protein [Elusimicrobia bacterium]|nr:zf-HC2 domain-containing protein [Candidatus Obscuribacterium magneticum]